MTTQAATRAVGINQKQNHPCPLKGHMGVGKLLFLIDYPASATPDPLRKSRMKKINEDKMTFMQDILGIQTEMGVGRSAEGSAGISARSRESVQVEAACGCGDGFGLRVGAARDQTGRGVGCGRGAG